jgi:hypothetical protein
LALERKMLGVNKLIKTGQKDSIVTRALNSLTRRFNPTRNEYLKLNESEIISVTKKIVVAFFV